MSSPPILTLDTLDEGLFPKKDCFLFLGESPFLISSRLDYGTLNHIHFSVLLGNLKSFKKSIRLRIIFEFQTKLVNINKGLAVLGCPGVLLYPGHQHGVTHTVRVEDPAVRILQETKFHLLRFTVGLTQGADYGPFFINHLQNISLFFQFSATGPLSTSRTKQYPLNCTVLFSSAIISVEVLIPAVLNT